MRSTPPQAPPLRTQIIAIAVVVGLFGVGAWSYVDYELSIEKVFDQRDENRLGRLASQHDGLQVVGIGTSMLRHATVRGDQVGELGEELESTVRYARLCRPAGGLMDWTSAVARVENAEPDVVVFESTYLFYRLRTGSILQKRYFRLCRSLFRQLVLPSESVQGPPAPSVFLDRWQRDRQTRRDLGEQRNVLRRQFWSQLMVFGLRPGAQELFRQLKARDIHIVVVEIPMKAATLATYPDGDRASMTRELEELRDAGVLSLYRCPLEFTDYHFLDETHLNPKGQRRFSRWLFSEIVDAEAKP